MADRIDGFAALRGSTEAGAWHDFRMGSGDNRNRRDHERESNRASFRGARGDGVSGTTPTCLFVDIGGVLLTDGWGHLSRQRAATRFGLDLAELERRHALNFTTYEEGRLTLDDYLDWVVFHRDRAFTRTQFRDFMFAESHPHPGMIALVAELKAQHGLKVAAVSNEARELNDHRIQTFGLARVIDFFVSSCAVHLRKPDPEMFRLALDIAQVPAAQIVYVENTSMFVQVAERLGIRGIVHTDATTTAAALRGLGLGLVTRPGEP